MKPVVMVVIAGPLSIGGLLQAHLFPTNNMQRAQAIKVASELRRDMREEDVSRIVEGKRGLRLGLRVGGSGQWYRSYRLADETFFDLKFEPKSIVQSGAWEGGLLEAAAITSNGVEVVSISLTNALQPSNAADGDQPSRSVTNRAGGAAGPHG